jgi:hypothetical protein
MLLDETNKIAGLFPGSDDQYMPEELTILHPFPVKRLESQLLGGKEHRGEDEEVEEKAPAVALGLKQEEESGDDDPPDYVQQENTRQYLPVGACRDRSVQVELQQQSEPDGENDEENPGVIAYVQ